MNVAKQKKPGKKRMVVMKGPNFGIATQTPRHETSCPANAGHEPQASARPLYALVLLLHSVLAAEAPATSSVD